MRPWTDVSYPANDIVQKGFNGATALRPWTGGDGDGMEQARDRLQWGHGLAAVDG